MSFERLAPSLHVRNEVLGFVRYIAPEILQDAGYEGFPVDVRPLSFLRVGIYSFLRAADGPWWLPCSPGKVWSSGIALYAMICGRLPFKALQLSFFRTQEIPLVLFQVQALNIPSSGGLLSDHQSSKLTSFLSSGLLNSRVHRKISVCCPYLNLSLTHIVTLCFGDFGFLTLH